VRICEILPRGKKILGKGRIMSQVMGNTATERRKY
jgi:hypothetical protein